MSRLGAFSLFLLLLLTQFSFSMAALVRLRSGEHIALSLPSGRSGLLSRLEFIRHADRAEREACPVFTEPGLKRRQLSGGDWVTLEDVFYDPVDDRLYLSVSVDRAPRSSVSMVWVLDSSGHVDESVGQLGLLYESERTMEPRPPTFPLLGDAHATAFPQGGDQHNNAHSWRGLIVYDFDETGIQCRHDRAFVRPSRRSFLVHDSGCRVLHLLRVNEAEPQSIEHHAFSLSTGRVIAREVSRSLPRAGSLNMAAFVSEPGRLILSGTRLHDPIEGRTTSEYFLTGQFQDHALAPLAELEVGELGQRNFHDEYHLISGDSGNVVATRVRVGDTDPGDELLHQFQILDASGRGLGLLSPPGEGMSPSVLYLDGAPFFPVTWVAHDRLLAFRGIHGGVPALGETEEAHVSGYLFARRDIANGLPGISIPSECFLSLLESSRYR